MQHPETHLCTNEHGPRPAGKPGECYSCRAPVGSDHKPDCTLRTRTVIMRYSYEVVVSVPEHWKSEDIEFHRNESSWCATNSLDDIKAMMGEDECLCPVFGAEYLREATKQDEQSWRPQRRLELGDALSHPPIEVHARAEATGGDSPMKLYTTAEIILAMLAASALTGVLVYLLTLKL